MRPWVFSLALVLVGSSRGGLPFFSSGPEGVSVDGYRYTSEPITVSEAYDDPHASGRAKHRPESGPGARRGVRGEGVVLPAGTEIRMRSVARVAPSRVRISFYPVRFRRELCPDDCWLIARPGADLGGAQSAGDEGEAAVEGDAARADETAAPAEGALASDTPRADELFVDEHPLRGLSRRERAQIRTHRVHRGMPRAKVRLALGPPEVREPSPWYALGERWGYADRSVFFIGDRAIVVSEDGGGEASPGARDPEERAGGE